MDTMKKVAAKISRTAKVHDRLYYLRARWNDERMYEDFQTYVVAAKKVLPRVVDARKSDFSFVVRCADGLMRVRVGTYQIRFLSEKTKFPRAGYDGGCGRGPRR